MAAAPTDDARLRKLDDLFSEFVARMVCVHPALYLRTGDWLSLVDDDPQPTDARNVVCRSCDDPLPDAERGRALCARCRVRTTVYQGAALINTMYRSAHPKFVLSREMAEVVAHIGRQRVVATQGRATAKQLKRLSQMVAERWRAGQGDMNVYITPNYVAHSGSYARYITCSNPMYTDEAAARDARPRHLAVRVGGLGLRLEQIVKWSVMEWLYQLDAMIRKRFGIALACGQNDGAIKTVVEHYATLIARRVVLLEECVENPTQHVCSEGFEHVTEIQFVRCKHYAAELARADVRSMRELARLAQEGEVPESRERLVAFLRRPCPELLKALPTVSKDMRFAELCAALSDASQAPAKAQAWAASVRVESLCLLLQRAIELTQTWKPAQFLQCVRHDAAPPPRVHPLPLQGWVDDPAIASWSLVSSETHAHRRTGLDPSGLRIVLMSSALQQLTGDGRFFRPGVMRCDLMFSAANSHEYVSTHAYGALTEQMWPYMAGEPWRYARTEMTKWQGSHIEDDVRKAAALLGGFSVAEIAERFGRSSSCPVQLAVQSARHAQLLRRTTDMMVVKPAAHYEQWFPLAVDLVLPILAQLRRGMGVANHVATDPTGDVLRLIGRVRAWKPADGPLFLTAGEVYKVPRAKTALKQLKAAGSPLVDYRRPWSSKGFYWILDRDQLARVLGQ